MISSWGFLGSIWSCFYKFKLASFIYKVSLFLVWLIHFIRLMIQILYFFMGFIGIHMRSSLPQVQKLITKFLSFLFNLIFKAMLEILITHDDAYFNFHFFFFSSCDLLKLQKIERKKEVGCSSNSIIWFHKVIFCSNFLGTKSCITGSESQGFPILFLFGVFFS